MLDDDAAQLQAMRIAFERRGATVIAARNQIEFWSEIEQLSRPPDLCVLDFVLGRTGTALKEGLSPTTANDLTWLKGRFGERTRAVVLAANIAHPKLVTIADTPVFEKPLCDAKFDAIAALLL